MLTHNAHESALVVNYDTTKYGVGEKAQFTLYTYTYTDEQRACSVEVYCLGSKNFSQDDIGGNQNRHNKWGTTIGGNQVSPQFAHSGS